MEQPIMLTAIYRGDGEYIVFRDDIGHQGDHESYTVYIDEDDNTKPCSSETTKYILEELSNYWALDTKKIEYIHYYTNTSMSLLDETGNWAAPGCSATPVIVQNCDLYGNPIPGSEPKPYLQMIDMYNTRYIPINGCHDIQSVGKTLGYSPYVDPNMIINFSNVEDGIDDNYHNTQMRMTNNELIIPATFVPRERR